jgi:hypothetical protein
MRRLSLDHRVRLAVSIVAAMRFYPALILVAVTVAGWGVGMYAHALIRH